MVGFTAFSERAGEEAAFTLMQSLAKLMEDAVREQGGVVQSFTGDGIMAVFGAPVAHEDAPLRACRAATAILERLKTASKIGASGGGQGAGRLRRSRHSSRRHCERRSAASSLGRTGNGLAQRVNPALCSRAGRGQLLWRASDQRQVRFAEGLSA